MKISDEEKKAINELWRFDYCYNEQIKTILNLIEKLQKENEKLKTKLLDILEGQKVIKEETIK